MNKLHPDPIDPITEFAESADDDSLLKMQSVLRVLYTNTHPIKEIDTLIASLDAWIEGDELNDFA